MIRQLTTRLLNRDSVEIAGMVSVQLRHQSSSEPAGNAPQAFPVPPLDQTLAKFLKSVKPLLSASQIETTIAACNKFSQNEGKKLQTLLEARGRERTNWLEEWWLNTAYLEYRDPVVLFSSPALVWPEIQFTDEKDRLQYTASLISAALSFNSILDRRNVPQEMSGKSPLDMGQYYKVFGTTRIPLSLRDAVEYQNPASPPDNIIVMINNNAFSVRVLDDQRNVLPTGVILASLEHAVKESKTAGVPVGVLTTEHRDRWARAYTLLARNPGNLQSLSEIDKALFVVALDKPLPVTNSRNHESHTSELLLHGGGFFKGNCSNRWFDKCIQFIVGSGSDGVGIAYEHSPAEGNPVGVMADFVMERLKTRKVAEPSANYPVPIKLKFEIVPGLNDAINTAGKNIDRLSSSLDVFGFKFNDFGKNQLKALKTSPDSFIQIAIQYAFYKVHGKPAAQYESGTLRKYQGGRTDVIRTCSDEAFAFCRSSGAAHERLAKLTAALASHKAYANDAISARGVDRHLLGLKLIAKENGLPIPEFFSDLGYVSSTYFQLSTSNVPTRNNGFMVYAPLVDDGYACCYNPRDTNINFGTSAWKHSNYTDLDKFQGALTEALRDMRDVLSCGQPQKAKL